MQHPQQEYKHQPQPEYKHQPQQLPHPSMSQAAPASHPRPIQPAPPHYRIAPQQPTMVHNQAQFVQHQPGPALMTNSAHQPSPLGPGPSPMPRLLSPPPGNPQMTSPQPAPPSHLVHPARLDDLVREIDPYETMDDDVRAVLLQMADDFADELISTACTLAHHRKASTLEVSDVQLALERKWNIYIPGVSQTDSKTAVPFRKAPSTEAHKQRMALIKKHLKKS